MERLRQRVGRLTRRFDDLDVAVVGNRVPPHVARGFGGARDRNRNRGALREVRGRRDGGDRREGRVSGRRERVAVCGVSDDFEHVRPAGVESVDVRRLDVVERLVVRPCRAGVLREADAIARRVGDRVPREGRLTRRGVVDEVDPRLVVRFEFAVRPVGIACGVIRSDTEVILLTSVNARRYACRFIFARRAAAVPILAVVAELRDKPGFIVGIISPGQGEPFGRGVIVSEDEIGRRVWRACYRRIEIDRRVVRLAVLVHGRNRERIQRIIAERDRRREFAIDSLRRRCNERSNAVRDEVDVITVRRAAVFGFAP